MIRVSVVVRREIGLVGSGYGNMGRGSWLNVRGWCDAVIARQITAACDDQSVSVARGPVLLTIDAAKEGGRWMMSFDDRGWRR